MHILNLEEYLKHIPCIYLILKKTCSLFMCNMCEWRDAPPCRKHVEELLRTPSLNNHRAHCITCDTLTFAYSDWTNGLLFCIRNEELFTYECSYEHGWFLGSMAIELSTRSIQVNKCCLNIYIKGCHGSAKIICIASVWWIPDIESSVN